MKETELKLRLLGDPVLRKKAKPVEQVTERHRQILSFMSQVMYEHSGIGLAAAQVGVSEAMIVVDIGSGLYKLVNPKIAKKSGEQSLEEGCLSIPGICSKVKRAKKVQVKAVDESGADVTVEAEGLFACVLQHEIDHLYGKVIVDYATFMDRIKIKKRLAELKEKYRNEKLSESETKSCKLQL
jgi:peptide deformylase